VSTVTASRTARRRPVTAPATPPALLPILIRLYEAGGEATAAQIDANVIYMGRLVAADLVRVKDRVKTGKPGRPAHVYAFTKLGRDRARRAARRQAVAA
jgi:hypothetical protein